MRTSTGHARTSVALLEQEWRRCAGDTAYLALLREEYGQFSTPSAQRDSYPKEKWDAEFIRLGDLSPKLAEEHWRAVPYCLFKQMNEAFCSPQDRCIPRNHQIGDLSKISLRGILINPDLVPEKLLKDLGLADFSKTAGVPNGRLIERCRPEVILGLKLALENAQSLERNNHRVLILNQSPDLKDYPEGTRTISEDAAGKLLITRTRDQQQGHRFLKVEFHPDPHSAMRSELHISASYNEERKDINLSLAEVRFIQQRLDKEWRGADFQGKEKLRKDAEAVLLSIIEKLEGAKNDHKVSAERLLALAKSIEDKLGKLNPTVALTRITAAIDRFEKRRKETHSIEKHTDADCLTLLDDMDYNWALLKRFRGSIERAAEIVGSSKISEQEGIEPHKRSENAQKILDQITLNPDFLLPFRMAPYVTFAKALNVNYSSLAQALKSGDREEAEKSLVRMQIIVKMHAAYEVFELSKTKALEVKQKGTEADAFSKLSELKDLFSKLKGFFDKRQILADVEVEPHFSELFESHRRELAKIEAGLNAAIAQGSMADAKGALDNVDNFIRDNFHIEEVVRAFIPRTIPTPKFPA